MRSDWISSRCPYDAPGPSLLSNCAANMKQNADRTVLIVPGSFLGSKIMKKLSAVGVIVGALVVCAAPVSFHWSPAKRHLCPSIEPTPASGGR